MNEENTDDGNQPKKMILQKSAYELAAEMENATMAPTVDSYGDQNVFLKYKQNKWFESISIIEIKRIKAEQETEKLKQIHDELRRQDRQIAKEQKLKELEK